MKTIKKLKISKDPSLLSKNELTTVKGGSMASASASFGGNPFDEYKKKKGDTNDPPKEIRSTMCAISSFQIP